MKAVILAAGLGSRINSITKNIPKSMIKINGKYIFKIIVESLVNSGIEEIIFVIGYKHKLLKAEILKELEGFDYKLQFVINKDFTNTNTMYSLWLAKHHLDCSFISLHGDLIFNNKMFLDFIQSGKKNIKNNLIKIYSKLISKNYFKKIEMDILKAWLKDIY